MRSQRAFGEALRRHREQSGVTIESIARQTKLGASMLNALERGDCSRWPAGIYSRSYVREYAEAIGLDPDDLAAQFSACFPAIAFPDRPVAAGSSRAGNASAESLRLTFVAEPNVGWRTARRRAALVVLDLLLVVVLSAALWMTVAADFWMAVAGVAVACHVIGLAGGGSAAGFFASLFRGTPEPAPAETPQETAVAEPA